MKHGNGINAISMICLYLNSVSVFCLLFDYESVSLRAEIHCEIVTKTSSRKTMMF